MSAVEGLNAVAAEQDTVEGLTTPANRPSGIVLSMLILVYILNFVDRQILTILAAPIQADLGLTDAQMGLLGGLAFAILYSTLGVPLALLADRTSRSWVITGSLVVWSGFTALCAFAQGFWHLFLSRVGVGMGEAGGVAPSYALISEYFPKHRRAWALALYALGIPLGSAIGILAGGYIAQEVNWRTAFLVVGLSGVLVAPFFKWVVKDKPRGQLEEAIHRPSLRAVCQKLITNPAFLLLSAGASAGSIVGYGLAFWLPILLQRSLGLNLLQTSWFMGALLLLGGCVGVLGGGFTADRLAQSNTAWYARVPGLAYGISIALYAAAISVSNVPLAFILFLIPQALSYVWLGPVIAAIQNMVKTHERATASACFLLINNMIGMGGGIYAMGALSTALTPMWGNKALQYSIITALPFYGLAAACMFAASHLLKRNEAREGIG